MDCATPGLSPSPRLFFLYLSACSPYPPSPCLPAESTNDRLLHFSVFSMACLLVLGVWQVLYLKRYFRQKKLI